MADEYFRIPGGVIFRICGRSADSAVLSFQLRRCSIAEPAGLHADITWYPAIPPDEDDQNVVAIRPESEAHDTDTRVRLNEDGSWDCFGPSCFGAGHNFTAAFQDFVVRNGSTFVHAAGLTVNGRGAMVCGRGGIGKSALSFAAFTDDRIKLLSDDKIVASGDGQAFTFPMPHALYPYHRPLLPATAQERLRVSSTQSRVLGPLYENPLTRPIGRAAKRWLVLRGGKIGAQAARVRPHYVQVHSDELFEAERLVNSAQIELFVFLSREGEESQTSKLELETARSLLLSATYLELDLDTALSRYALAEVCDRAKHWQAAADSATAFLSSCDDLIRVRIPRSCSPREVQAWLLDFLSERLPDYS